MRPNSVHCRHRELSPTNRIAWSNFQSLVCNRTAKKSKIILENLTIKFNKMKFPKKTNYGALTGSTGLSKYLDRGKIEVMIGIKFSGLKKGSSEQKHEKQSKILRT